MSIAKQDFKSLKQAYADFGGLSEWNEFETVICGASNEHIAQLKEKFPLIPQSLIDLLKIVDGTYWREYQGQEIAFYLLTSIPDEFNYPCYLNSSEQILTSDEIVFLADYINRDIDPDWGVEIDDKIIDDFDKVHWLHFSDSMNNGGTSKLFIDSSPSESGKIGQVVMYLHDPDELTVIADSFDEYLQMLINSEFAFVEDIADDFEESEE
ncbi:SMI1/KNR4 family protein [Moraxella equi]|uniref:SMI1 / KNR4 family n=1 Tax=Moraxella equi TaxID=60442 RepID=A0A378QT51_9GAMM|nr:SMI1/KNR4 family protein [Moraxella equi]OPH36938.1 SMI1 / KNR4 family protein [Moraxella equi]STZ03464.1 SMI1 / KNR4 family [Moraxella equi]